MEIDDKDSPSPFSAGGSPENTDSGSPTPLTTSAPPHVPPHVHPGSTVGIGGEQKKKRGRPRKYDAEGNLNPAYAAAAARKAAAMATQQTQQSAAGGFSLTMMAPAEYEQPKRGRGRGGGAATNWQHIGSLGELLANTAGVDFTPHIITVQTGEDVAATILSFSQKGPRGICILSANGAISNVTIRQPGSSGGLLTYEGRFEILSLTGSYTFSESSGVRSRTGGVSISLAGPDGRVVGGSVAGWLIAASPIQVVVGTFMPMGSTKTPRRRNLRESPTAVPFPAVPESMASPTTQTTPHSTHIPDVGPPQPAGHGHGHGHGHLHGQIFGQSHSEPEDSLGSGGGHNLNVVSSHNTPEWNNGGSSEPSPDQRLYPDINVSVSAI